MTRSRRKAPEVIGTVTTTEFLNTLNSVQSGLSTKEVMLQSTSFVFKNGFVTTFNDSIAMTAPTGLDPSFNFAVDAKTLLTFIKKVKKKEIDLSLSGKKLLINGKVFMTGIVVNEINLPLGQLDFTEDREWIDIPTDFFYYLKMSASVCSKESDKFSNVHITNDVVEACDNRHIIICDFPTDIGKQEALINAKVAIQLCKHNNMVQYHFGNSWITFRNAIGVMFACRNIVEKYPILQQMVDGKTTKNPEVITLPKELSEAIKRAAIFKSDETNVFGLTVYLTNDEITVESMNNYGFHRETLDIIFNGDIGFAIDPEYLIYILEETDNLYFHEETKCITFTDREEYVTHLVMLTPVK